MHAPSTCSLQPPNRARTSRTFCACCRGVASGCCDGSYTGSSISSTALYTCTKEREGQEWGLGGGNQDEMIHPACGHVGKQPKRYVSSVCPSRHRPSFAQPCHSLPKTLPQTWLRSLKTCSVKTIVSHDGLNHLWLRATDVGYRKDGGSDVAWKSKKNERESGVWDAKTLFPVTTSNPTARAQSRSHASPERGPGNQAPPTTTPAHARCRTHRYRINIG